MSGHYRRLLEAKGYVVSADERADHRALLDRTAPLASALSDLAADLYRQGKLDNLESDRLQEAARLLRSICVPMAVLVDAPDRPRLRLPGRTAQPVEEETTPAASP